MADKLFNVFNQEGYELYMVGGCVRDHILGVPAKDIDYATNALPDETIRILKRHNLKPIPIGIEFGTIQTIVDDEKVEITTYRHEESYKKGSRKPSVKFGKTIQDDLERRDFTFNAMAMDGKGKIIDPFGGQSDLKSGIITTPSEPHISFQDDPLRMLRACRFVARGLGRMDESTGWACSQLRHKVHEVSAERIFEEMTKLLLSTKPSDGIKALSEFGLLRELFPELANMRHFLEDQGKYHHLPVWEHTMLVLDSAEPTPTVRWSALFHDVAKPATWSKRGEDVHFYKHDQLGSDVWKNVADRLKTSKDFKEHVSQLIFEHQNLRGSMGDKGVRRLVHRLGDRLDDLFELRRADIVGHKPSLMKSSLDDLAQLKRRAMNVSKTGSVNFKMPRGTGDKVAEALGIKPGTQLGSVMKQLQQQLVDGSLGPESDFVEEAKRLWIGKE